jgi:hypothetical protein
MVNILIQIHDQACRMIRRKGGSITLLQMMSVSHPLWLGYESGSLGLSPTQYCDLGAYKATAEDYGVHIEIQPMQYVTRNEALVQAADMLDTDFVFSKEDAAIFKQWSALQNSGLARQLARSQRRLFTLDERGMAHCQTHA